ncbi:MAG: efflux RND transporter periplasmic adaptor subunit [Candidatus Latescibacteria bacterium]|nr:efflux RND transporter periplasmic adaptor subunit [Candidatus Latescibacterota bacterium]
MNKKKLFIILGVILLIIIIIVLNLVFKEQGVLVETKPAQYGSITSKVSGDGQLKAEAQVNIQAQTMGIVEKLHVKEGGYVNKGQLVCVLDQKSAKANLDLAQVQFEQAAQAFVRTETLYSQNLISLENYETAQAAYRTARARLEQAQDSYHKTMIHAPISGTVTQLNIEQGEAVMIGTMNNPGTVLMVIADLSKMIGIIDLDETEVPLVKTSARAIVRMDAFPDTTFSGLVSRVGYMPKQSVLAGVSQATDFEVEIKLDKTTPDLRPGMSINAEIITSEKDSILLIPIQSAGRRKLKGEETQTVFVVEKDAAKLKAIKTGIASETDLEILEGIEPGEIVITGPYKILAKLKDGDKVKFTKTNQN